jgi:hypothetical protein
MKVTPAIAAFALASLLACGDGSGTIYTLSTGTYTLSNTSAVAPDNCNLGPTFPDNTRITLTVASGNVTFTLGQTADPARNPVASIQGNTIGAASKTYDFDYNTLPPAQRFNCVETDTITVVGGSLLANDQLNATISFSSIMKSGSQCLAQSMGYKVFPCSSTETFIAKKM